MKKHEMIKNLNEWGFGEHQGTLIEDLPWGTLQTFYKEKEHEISQQKRTLPPVQEFIEERIEHFENLSPLEKTRRDLMPQIISIMKKLKGQTHGDPSDIADMFRLYNLYYLRNDSPNCGLCVARVYDTFKKITKGLI